MFPFSSVFGFIESHSHIYVHSLFLVCALYQAKDQMLIDTLETISRHRTETSKAAAQR